MSFFYKLIFVNIYKNFSFTYLFFSGCKQYKDK